MTPMMHKGYAARIEYSDEDECFVGRVAGIKSIITFHGESVSEVRQAFREAIDFYLETCAARGESPDNPFSGKIMTSIPPELHAQAISMAETLGKSLNQFVAEAIERAVKS
ncbi:MAG: type II toxin-antitoxin system HicB family antitoxin [Magnetococcales bacterium]|nr:type II toxin-antitoxin system HicB family antitoxin [Magnetococcales bacterium]